MRAQIVRAAVIGASATILISSLAVGQDLLGSVMVHGYGAWGYGDTDGNSYLLGTAGGSYDNASLALNLSARPSDRLAVFGQVDWHLDGDEVNTSIDFAFAEWRVNDGVRLRMGQVKQPFGIYTEIFEVGTLRPFINLPQGIYGSSGIIGEAYRGLGLRGTTFLASRWAFEYDVYFGGLENEFGHPIFGVLGSFDPGGGSAGSPSGAMEMAPTVPDSKNVIGGRVVVRTPVDGFTVGVSAYTGEPDQQGENLLSTFIDTDFRRTSIGAQVEYLDDRWTARAEYVNQDLGNLDQVAAYAEVAYFLSDNWQLAGRYDRNDWSGLEQIPSVSALKIVEHRDVGLAVNYWFGPEVVVKLEYHQVDGTRFAAPPADELLEGLLTGRLVTETELLQIAVQFSF